MLIICSCCNCRSQQFRSSGITAKSIKEEARKTVIDNLTKAPEVPAPPPSPGQTFFGAVVAGGIALGLYKFTSGVEAGFSVKAVSQDYSVHSCLAIGSASINL